MNYKNNIFISLKMFYIVKMNSVNAVCILKNEKEGIMGIVNFSQRVDTPNRTRVFGTIKGLEQGLHGFHIHTYGDLSNGCDSAGPHFNPNNQDHGGLRTEVRHVGDFGNLESFGKMIPVEFDFIARDLNLIGPYSIIGRSVIIHADPDDLGLTSNPLSKTTGNSGARIVCGVIGISASK
jgi:Cu-Zn family superoxide dismutase